MSQPMLTADPRALVTAALAAAAPLLLLSFGLWPAPLPPGRGRSVAARGAAVSLAALAAAVLADVRLACGGPIALRWPLGGECSLGVYWDALSAMVLTLVAFLLAVISRFSVNYLAGDPAQGRFTRWLCLTGGAVMVLVISANLLQFALAWSATSLCLHQLLVFYPGRPGAILAARKKFIVSRLGDACLLSVIVLVMAHFHTWDFASLFTFAGQSPAPGKVAGSWPINAIGLLLVAGAMLKSAQFPFHSWLPDTMETPTPVSALMHAGIINAGGYLILRLHPLVTLSPPALTVLALFGAFTALFASLVMLTHASVKRALAFSTVAQMGFMMFECGLGAFDLALLHLLAHSLYKAHAFLASGSMVQLEKSAWVPTGQPRAHRFTLAAAAMAAVALVLGGGWLGPLAWRHEPGQWVLTTCFTMALAYALWNLWSRALTLPLAIFGGVFAVAIVLVYWLLHGFIRACLGAEDWANAQLGSLPGVAVLGAVLILFLAVLVLQTELPQWAQRPWMQALYVHARNGFYFNTLANRAVARLWPLNSQTEPR